MQNDSGWYVAAPSPSFAGVFNGERSKSQILPLRPSRFTKQFKRLVNFLNFRKNMNKSSWTQI